MQASGAAHEPPSVQALIALRQSAGNAATSRYLQRLRTGESSAHADEQTIARKSGKKSARGGGAFGAIAAAARRVIAAQKRAAKKKPPRGKAGDGGSLSARIDTA